MGNSQDVAPSGALHKKAITSILGLIVVLAILKVLVTCIYNVYFHPLRKYPGPKIAAATGLFYFYKAFRGEEAVWECFLHENYGEVVRIGPDRLSFISPEAWKDITGYSTGKRLENPKDPNSLPANIHGNRSLVTETSSEIHRPRRRIYAYAFSDKALKQQEPLIRNYADSLVRVVKESSTNSPKTGVDICKLLNCTTFDIMAELTFGEPLGLLQQSEFTPWVAAIFKHIRNTLIMRMASEYPVLQYLLKAITPKSIIAAAHRHYNHSAERVEKRMRQGIDIGKPDIWKLVMEKSERVHLPKHIMVADASTFMVAGTETTATLLSGLVFLLLKHPKAMKTLQDEVRALKKEDLTIEVLPHLPFMAACLLEASRMYPPVPIPLFRKVAKGGNTICGEWIPENTRVAVSQYAAYHSPLNFRDPDSFIPERWLPDSGYNSDRKDILNIFSTGPRNCIGQNLANHEMRIILATLLWDFDLELCPESENWMDQEVCLLWVKPKLMVKASSSQNHDKPIYSAVKMVRISSLFAFLSMGTSVLATAAVVANDVAPGWEASPPVVAEGGSDLVLRAVEDGRVPGSIIETSLAEKAGIAGAINGIVEKILVLIEKIENDIERRKQFTQDVVRNTHAQFPGFNIVVCNVGYSLAGPGFSSVTSVTYKAQIGTPVTFDVVLFSSPKTFVRRGDGGFQNWAYMIGSHCTANGGTLNCPAH
ncbi:cytochrome P450 [Curvularia clavata]|uniref:Cytochrome P450 n=1 Tax=Curvularia clavata TaxID=95742 RepID=A0A9Q9DVZ7_CURCL|nr:cytochrome P450 [Curvularia clavata]